MAPEQQNYIEKAKLQITTPEMVDVMKDPSKFDEKAFRKFYQDKLDKEVGKKQLSPREMKMYMDANAQIDKNIQDLKDAYDYAKAKVAMKIVLDETKKIQNPRNDQEAGGLGVKFILLKNFQAEKYGNILLTIDKQVTDVDVEKGKNRIRTAMDTYYGGYIKSGANFEIGELKSAGSGEAKLSQYYEVYSYLEELDTLVSDKFEMSNKPKEFSDMAIARIKEVKLVLESGKKKLSTADQKLVNEFEKSKKGPARVMVANADKFFLNVAKDSVLVKRQLAVEYGANTGNFEEANKLFAEGLKQFDRNPKEAQRLFQKAESKYDLYVQMAKSTKVKRVPIDQLVEQQRKSPNKTV